MQRTFKRLPRKIKKGLKASVLKGKDPNWKTKECKIKGIVKAPHRVFNQSKNKFKNFAVQAYTLGY